MVSALVPSLQEKSHFKLKKVCFIEHMLLCSLLYAICKYNSFQTAGQIVQLYESNMNIADLSSAFAQATYS